MSPVYRADQARQAMAAVENHALFAGTHLDLLNEDVHGLSEHEAVMAKLKTLRDTSRELQTYFKELGAKYRPIPGIPEGPITSGGALHNQACRTGR